MSLAVGHPFDTIKVRLQTMRPTTCQVTGGRIFPYKGSLDCLMKTVRCEGVPSLFRGMGGLAVTSLPRFSILWYVNSWGRLLVAEAPTSGDFNARQIVSGAILSQLVVAPLIVNPLERAKVLLQTSHKQQLKGQVDCYAYIYRTEGIKGLFRGASLTLGRDIPSFCTFFLVYETLRSRVRESYGEVGPVATASIGGLAGMAGWAVAIPLDSLKNRHQVCLGQRSVLHTVKTVLNEGGLRQLYRGGVLILVRAFPANAAAFLGYEWTIQLLDLLDRNRRPLHS